jgi:hypothetical protein
MDDDRAATFRLGLRPTRVDDVSDVDTSRSLLNRDRARHRYSDMSGQGWSRCGNVDRANDALLVGTRVAVD